MTERIAPQLLFDDGTRAIQQTASTTLTTPAAVSARGSISIAQYYETTRLASEIFRIVKQQQNDVKTKDSGWFARVALQFPDELLCDSPEVCWEMQDALEKLTQQPSLVFCLGDTTFGPCCPDEVAALHLQANVLVHYGHACLTHPPLQLPVLYGFGVSQNWDTESAVEAILQQAKAAEVRRILLLYQVKYQHAMEDLQTQLSERGDLLMVTGEIPREAFDAAFDRESNSTNDCEMVQSCSCLQRSGDCTNNTSNSQSEPQILKANGSVSREDTSEAQNSKQQSIPVSRNTLLLGGLDVPKDLNFSTFAVVFVGDDPQSGNKEAQRQYMNTVLWYLSCKQKPIGLWTYAPQTKSLFTSTPPGIQRQLNRRFYLIQKARDASIYGILIGTLSQRYFRSVVSSIEHLIKQNGRTPYNFAMGKVNPAKVANFAEIDCFVMVACAETSWLDEGEQREMHVPIITPLELHMALGSGGPQVQWGECHYSLNYDDFLAKYLTGTKEAPASNSGDDNSENDDVEDSDEKDDAPYFSMITGKYEPAKKGSVAKGLDLKALPGKGQLTTYKSEAAEFLKNREYKGLETKLGETDVHVAIAGQQGIASKYDNDMENIDKGLI